MQNIKKFVSGYLVEYRMLDFISQQGVSKNNSKGFRKIKRQTKILWTINFKKDTQEFSSLYKFTKWSIINY